MCRENFNCAENDIPANILCQNNVELVSIQCQDVDLKLFQHCVPAAGIWLCGRWVLVVWTLVFGSVDVEIWLSEHDLGCMEV